MRSKRRGFALIDYMAGTLILLGALLSLTALHTIKSRALDMARCRQNATFAVAAALGEGGAALDSDAALRRRAFAELAQLATPGSWVTLRTTSEPAVTAVNRNAICVLRVRAVEGLPATRGFELNARVSWSVENEGPSSLELSTLFLGGNP